MTANLARCAVVLACSTIALTAQQLPLPGIASFGRGDVLVSLEPGPVLWYLPDGTFRAVLVSTVPGTGEGMAFDPEGKLYVTRWCADPNCNLTGNTVEVFNTLGVSTGTFGSGYDCSPHAIVFKADGTAYVGQAGCSGDVLRFTRGTSTPVAFNVVPEFQGSFWIDMGADGCTLFYTSIGPNVKRYDTCARMQLPNFNAAPLPGGFTHDLRVMPDGGVLVASGQMIARLDASGRVMQTYSVPEDSLWAGLDLAGDGTFWAANYRSSRVYRFDLTTGAVRDMFFTGTPPNTAVGVLVKK